MINTLFKDFRIPKSKKTTIDNFIFQLHYKFTTILLVAFTLLVTGRQYIGDPIHCTKINDIPEKLVDTFCWIHTTYSVNEAWHKKVGTEVVYPGVMQNKDTVDKSDVTYHAYYQWVCFVLFLQALFFYTPHLYWKSVIGDRIKHLIVSLDNPVAPREEKLKHRNLLCEYLRSSLKHHNNQLFLGYIFAEFLNFFNVIGQMFLLNKFLNGHFMAYGLDVISFSEWDGTLRYDPMIRVFPRMTKCKFSYYGSSGDVQLFDSLCILPVNILNEKIFIFLWFWFILLAVLSSLVLVYRFFYIVFIPLRFVAFQSRNRIINRDHLRAVLNCCRLSDWILLNFLAKNIDSIHFRDLISDLAMRMTITDKDSSTA